MISKKEEILVFLEENIGFFYNHICFDYPLSDNIIEKYKDHLDWELLSSNENLEWSVKLIAKFENYWNWESLSGNESIPWSDFLLIRYANKWHWKEKENAWDCCLAENKSVKWSYNILKRFPEKINWGMISKKVELLNKYPQILKEFSNKLDWDSISGNEFISFTEELIENLSLYWNWDLLSGNRAVNWTQELITKYQTKFNPEAFKTKNWELWLNINWKINPKPEPNYEKYSTEEVSDLLKNAEWNNMSCDLRMPWTIDLLERYKDFWNWNHLSLNSNLPWSFYLIDKFKYKWEWGHEELTKEGTLLIASGLTINTDLPWSQDLIRAFKDYWFWPDLSAACYIPWSLELLNEFQDKWIWANLVSNKKLWETVFYPYLDEVVIDDLLTISKNSILST